MAQIIHAELIFKSLTVMALRHQQLEHAICEAWLTSWWSWDVYLYRVIVWVVANVNARRLRMMQGVGNEVGSMIIMICCFAIPIWL